MFDILLLELEPVCTAEQEFVQKFFDFCFDEPEVSINYSRTTPKIPEDRLRTSEDSRLFPKMTRTLPKIAEDDPKISENYPRSSKDFRT